MRNQKSFRAREQKGRVKLFSSRQIKIGLFLALVLFFLYYSSLRTIENFRLARHGKLAKAVVIERKDVGGAAAVTVIYTFEVEGVKYISDQSNEPFQVGDTIDVLYLANNPHVTRTYRFIKNNYDTKIGRN